MQEYYYTVSNSHQEIMRRRRTTQDERYPSVADLLPSWERLSEEPKKKLLTIRRGEGGEERRGGPLDVAGE